MDELMFILYLCVCELLVYILSNRKFHQAIYIHDNNNGSKNDEMTIKKKNLPKIRDEYRLIRLILEEK